MADLERLPDLRSVVGLVQTIACQDFDFILAYVVALFRFMLLLFYACLASSGVDPGARSGDRLFL